MAENMLHNLKDKGFQVKNFVMDNDATTISIARSNFYPNIQRFSDLNHTKKNFTNKLFRLKNDKKYSLLGAKTIKHITKLFAYVVKSNKDPVNLKKNLQSIPCHVFGVILNVMNGANIKKIRRFTVQKFCRTAGISLAMNYFKTSYFYLEHLPK